MDIDILSSPSPPRRQLCLAQIKSGHLGAVRPKPDGKECVRARGGCLACLPPTILRNCWFRSCLGWSDRSSGSLSALSQSIGFGSPQTFVVNCMIIIYHYC
jgi:hypothetical protein